MSALLWLPPLFRALTTALIVVTASAVAEALGLFWGALIASLPVSAGPAYVFLALQHGPDYVAASALSSFAANAATGCFLIAYARLAPRLPPWRSLALAVLAWLAASLLILQIPWTPTTALLLNLATYATGIAWPGPTPNAERTPPPAPRRPQDLLLRAIAVAAFVTAIVALSTILGPAATGIAAVFPVSLISLIAIVRPRIGGAAASRLAAGALRAMLGFGLALLALHLAIPHGTAAALVLALLVSLGWTLALLLTPLGRRRL
jgi:hypothetical protein